MSSSARQQKPKAGRPPRLAPPQPQIVPSAPGEPDFRPAITIGLGIKITAQGQRKYLGDDFIADLAGWLEFHTGRSAWLSPHTWLGNKRKKEKWESAVAVFVDFDCADHGLRSEELGEKAIAALGGEPNLIYLTPHGIRAIFVLEAPSSDGDAYKRAVEGAIALCDDALNRAELSDLEIDLGATKDLARGFYTPCSTVPCKHSHAECGNGERSAEVLRVRATPWSEADLIALAPDRKSPGKKRAPKKSGKGKGTGEERYGVAANNISSADGLAEALGRMGAERKGDDLVFRCPNPQHEDKHPSARFNDRKGKWYCDSCRAGGGWEYLLALLIKDGRIELGAEGKQQIFVRFYQDEVPLSDLIPQAIAQLAVNRSEEVFARGRSLVQIVREKEPGVGGRDRDEVCGIAKIPKPVLRGMLDRDAEWITFRPKGKSLVQAVTLCPTALVDAVHNLQQWGGVRPLNGVICAPTLRPDGTILCEPGYDEATSLFYAAARDYPDIPESPSEADAKAAVQAILEPFEEFPFECEADKASLLAFMLTAVARHAVQGPVPHWAVLAPTFGAGKTLLVEAATTAMTGRAPIVMAPTGGRRADAEAEMRKRITSTLISGPRVVVIDNVDDGAVFESKSLAALLTTEVWSDRELGKSEELHLLNSAVWVSTGCNYSLWEDLVRRSLSIKLDPGVEDPHLNAKFSIEDLIAYVSRHHPELLGCALTILRGYFVAGKPHHGKPLVGKFEAWDRLIRGATIWAATCAGWQVDPFDTNDRLRQESPDRTAFGALLREWHRVSGGVSGMTVKKAIARSNGDPEFYEAIAAVAAKEGYTLDPKRLGNFLRARKGFIAGGLRLEQAGTHQGAVLWVSREVPSGGRRRGLGESGESGESGDAGRSRVNTCARTQTHVHDGAIHRAESDSPHSPDSPPRRPASPAAPPSAHAPSTGRADSTPGLGSRVLCAPHHNCRGCGRGDFHQLKARPQWICSTCHPPPEGAEVVEQHLVPNASASSSSSAGGNS